MPYFTYNYKPECQNEIFNPTNTYCSANIWVYNGKHLCPGHIKLNKTHFLISKR